MDGDQLLGAFSELQSSGGAAATDQSDAQAAKLEKSCLNILVADDNQVNLRIIQIILSHIGHRVDTVENGQQAVDACRGKRYDAVLMDLQMPLMDGLTATRRLVELFPQRSSRPLIIALTAAVTREDYAACMAAGMDDFLKKPVRPADIVACLEKYF